MDADSALTTIATLLLVGALAAAVYVWLTYSRWTELRFRHRDDRMRSHEVVGALRDPGDPDDHVSRGARRTFFRALGLFLVLLVAAVALLELRELV